MTTGAAKPDGLREFARAHGLEFSESAALPAEGELLTRDSLDLLGAASGALRGGEQGTLAHLSYTYTSNDATHTRRLTVVILSLPETIGFAPYVSGGRAGMTHGLSAGRRSFELDGGGDVRAVSREHAGRFGTTAGALIVTGDGSKRDHRIALVAGPTGPTASAELSASAPGISAPTLDRLSRRLAAERAAVAR